MIRLLLLSTIVTGAPAWAQPPRLTIQDNPTGGDCAGIGQWAPAEKTCTLTQDVTGSIELASDGVTLDGNQRTLTAPQPAALPFGVLAEDRRNTEIRGLVITGFSQGVRIQGGAQNRILNNELRDLVRGGCGICLSGTTLNTVSDNRVTKIDGDGVVISAQSSQNHILANKLRLSTINLKIIDAATNLVRGNTIEGDGQNFVDGVVLMRADGNQFYENEIFNYGGAGATLDLSNGNQFWFNTFSRSTFLAALVVRDSKDNKIVCNDFDANGTGVRFDFMTVNNAAALNNLLGADTAVDLGGPKANKFDLGQPLGNHWNVNAPACVDANPVDGICDAPYVFNGNLDNWPHVMPIPWRNNRDECLKAGPPQPIDPPPQQRPPQQKPPQLKPQKPRLLLLP